MFAWFAAKWALAKANPAVVIVIVVVIAAIGYAVWSYLALDKVIDRTVKAEVRAEKTKDNLAVTRATVEADRKAEQVVRHVYEVRVKEQAKTKAEVDVALVAHGPNEVSVPRKAYIDAKRRRAQEKEAPPNEEAPR